MGLSATAMGMENTYQASDTTSEINATKEIKEVKKHVATIHCSNTLTLLQRKISNALLYHAYHELMQREEHAITIKQLCHLIAYQGHNHAAIKEALKGLISTVIEWNVVNDSTGLEDWTASSMLASVSLQGPICLFAYSPRMKQLLHSPTMFGKINLYIQSRFKSNYGLALYENSTRYRGLPYTKWFDLALFRKLMGVPADKYTVFRDFKKRVLDKSIEEVNTYSDLIVEAEVCREGRQVTKVRFALKDRAKKIRLGNPVTTSNTIDKLEEKLLAEYKLSREQVRRVLADYRVDVIAEKMALIESSSHYQQGKVNNLAGYLMSALKNDYQPAKSSQGIVDDVQRQKTQVAMLQQAELQQLAADKAAFTQYRETAIDAAMDELTAEEKTTLLEKFYRDAAAPIKTVLKLQRGKYTEETVCQSPQIKALLRQFIVQELPLFAEQLFSYEEWSKCNLSE